MTALPDGTFGPECTSSCASGHPPDCPHAIGLDWDAPLQAEPPRGIQLRPTTEAKADASAIANAYLDAMPHPLPGSAT